MDKAEVESVNSEGSSNSRETGLVSEPSSKLAELCLVKDSSPESAVSTPSGSDEEAGGSMDGAHGAAVQVMDEFRSDEGWMHLDA